MSRLKSYVLAMLFAVTIGGGVFAFITPQASTAGAACTDRVLTFPTWYRGVGTCTGHSIQITADPKKLVLTIALNIVEIIIQLVAYACTAFIIYGGFIYIIGAGESSKIAGAKNTILNAIIGLVISMLSVVIVNIIVGNLSGGSGTTNGVSTASAGEILAGILKTAYWLGGICAVIVIIVSGIMYATSQGESAKIQRAKNGILYSVVGLVVIALAFVITNIVVGKIGG